MYIYCKDHFRFTCPMLEHYDFRIHFSTLTFSFFIIFILNYAIFNLQLFAKMFRTYLAMMKLGTVIPYLMKIQKIHLSQETALVFC